MEATVENAIRSVAKDALAEIIEVKEKYPIQEHDKHFTEILNRHAKKSSPYLLNYNQKLSRRSAG
ncbi:hypothetical protein [Yersinia aldovae]|uniref:hypothetical protein n=1 Tax=Yersinia aldovae TaxID=29483 RepID=UPI0005AC0E0C|nr:hypothetical protein [Yersinia aldovae]AJJ63892.1 hypothetical protein AT01_1297 [Yersinia aldovae 670-83]